MACRPERMAAYDSERRDPAAGRADVGPLGCPFRPDERQGPPGGGVPDAHPLPEGPGPGDPLQVLSQTEAQDPGVPLPRGGPLQDPADPHSGGGPDRQDHRQGVAAQRGSDRGRGPGPRPGAHPLRPRRGAGFKRPAAPGLPPLRAERAGGGQAGKGRPGAEPDLGGEKRHPVPHLRHGGGDRRGPHRPVGGQDRLHQPRHRRRHPGRGAPGGGHPPKDHQRPGGLQDKADHRFDPGGGGEQPGGRDRHGPGDFGTVRRAQRLYVPGCVLKRVRQKRGAESAPHHPQPVPAL